MGQLLVEPADGEDALPVRPRDVVLDDAAKAEGVVSDDHAADAEIFFRPGELGGIASLVGVDEAEIERSLAFDLREQLQRCAYVDADPPEHSCLPERVAGDLGVFGRDLEGVEHSAIAHSAQEANAAVAAEGPDLDRLARSRDAGQDLE